MEKPPINLVNKVELPKNDQTLEHFPISEQDKNIQEVFRLSPELEDAVVEATKSDETIYLYRVENKNIEKEPDGITSHKDLKGQWFTPDLKDASDYLRKSQKIKGANLVIVKISKAKFENLHVSKHPIASQMDVESNNYIVPENIERNYITLDDVQDKLGNLENLNKAKEQIREKVEQFETKEAVELYREYLKTIFPESKVQDIVWHGTTSEEEFDNFDIEKESSFGFEKHGGVFFTSMIEDAKTRGSGNESEKAKKIIPVLMNVKNPLITGQKEFPATAEDTLASGKEEIDALLANKEVVKRWQEIGWTYRIENDELIVTKPIMKKQAGLMNSEGNLVVDLSQNAMFIGNISQWTTKPLANVGYDTIIDNNAASSGLNIQIGLNDQGRVLQPKSWFISLKADNIHILGSKNDIEKFKEFILNKEGKEDRQSIEEFLREQGLEKVPHIETDFLFHKHATTEGGEKVADRLEDKDILIQENAGWDNERLETWRKVSSGEFTPDQAIEYEKSRGKEFFWPEYFKAILKKLHGSNKEVLLVDIKNDDELYQEMYEFMKGNSAYNDLVSREYSYNEILERISDVSELESMMQKGREDKILANVKTNLFELLKEKPELQNKEDLKIIFPMGAFHTRLYHEMKKQGDDVNQEFSPSPYMFDPRQSVERLIHFKGSERAKEYMPKILLYWLLRKSNIMSPDNISHEVLSRFSDEQIGELFEMFRKSESDEKFKVEAQNWIVEQFKKK